MCGLGDTPLFYPFVLSYLEQKPFLQVTLEETQAILKTWKAELPSTDQHVNPILEMKALRKYPSH